jgi:tetratricopeptide (TPR) repeat protein
MNGPFQFLVGVFAALFLAAAPAWSCINTFKLDLRYPLPQGDPATVDETIRQLEQAHAQKPTLETGNDLGVVRVLTGKIDEAIALFRETEKNFPGNARVAANLGTALELKGENEEALEWIREGANRDASEHQGSEWLHVRILTAKIALLEDPGWFNKNRVLTLDFGSGDVPVAPEILPVEKGKLKGAEVLLRQIDYQLMERTNFVKPPDAIVGDLYASSGDLAIASGLSPLDGGNERADRYYEKALAYGAPHADLIRKRLARYQADLAALPAKLKAEEEVMEYPAPAPFSKTRVTVWTSIAAAIGLGLAGFLVFRFRRKRKDSQS